MDNGRYEVHSAFLGKELGVCKALNNYIFIFRQKHEKTPYEKTKIRHAQKRQNKRFKWRLFEWLYFVFRHSLISLQKDEKTKATIPDVKAS